MTDQYTVLGNPIAHSKSPDIHTAFARQLDEDMVYDKTLVELNGFDQAVAEFIAKGGKGLNITVPFKEEAYQRADKLSKRARQAGAVNTYIIDDGGAITGDNTDGVGMVKDILENHQWPISGKRVLLLGAGGAVRGVLGPLLEQNPAGVVIANRTVEKAQNLAQAFSSLGNVVGVGFDDIDNESFDMIINGTSASLAGEVPPIKPGFSAKTQCYDMMYGKELTPFLEWAQKQGADGLADGLGMLVEQAAEAFYLWRGKRPQTREVILHIRGA